MVTENETVFGGIPVLIDLTDPSWLAARPVASLVDLANQVASIPPTDLYPIPPPAGLYTVSLYLQTTTAAGVAQVQARIDYSDEAGPVNFTSTEFLGALGRVKTSTLIRANGIDNIQYRATVVGAIAGAAYQLTVNVKPT